MFMKEKREEPCSKIDAEKLEELRKQAKCTETLAGCLLGEVHGGSADPEPPTLDALSDIAYGAKLIRTGTDKLREIS
jgi:hypothetical protein